RQVNAFFCQPVIDSSAIALLRFWCDDSRRLQPLQSLRQNIGGDAFARFLKLSESSEAAHHQIADDEQRPAVAEYLQRDADRAARPRLVFHSHQQAANIKIFACKMQAT